LHQGAGVAGVGFQVQHAVGVGGGEAGGSRWCRGLNGRGGGRSVCVHRGVCCAGLRIQTIAHCARGGHRKPCPPLAQCEQCL